MHPTIANAFEVIVKGLQEGNRAIAALAKMDPLMHLETAPSIRALTLITYLDLIRGELIADPYARKTTIRPWSEWHDDDGTVLWFACPIHEPPYVGSPGDSDWPWPYADNGVEYDYDDEERYELRWCPLPNVGDGT